MDTLLVRIKPVASPKLSDEEIVDECMRQLMERWPAVTGYQWERVEGVINILMWGELNK